MSGGLTEADYLKLDAMEIADLVRRKKISPTDALNAAIARAD